MPTEKWIKQGRHVGEDKGAAEVATRRVKSVIDEARRDLRLARRSLRASPLATSIAIISLGLAIGANTAVISLLNGLVLRPLPVHEPYRLVHVTDSVVRDTGETRVRAWSYPIWEQIRERPDIFEAATAWSFTRFDLASGGEAQIVDGIWADGGFFEALGVQASLGRTFSRADDRLGGGPDGPVAVVSQAYWQSRLSGTRDVVGRVVQLSGVPFTIVGVAPRGFFGVEVGRSFDFIVPLQTEALMRGRDSALGSAATNFLSILARVRPDQSLEDAESVLRRVQPEIRKATVGAWSADVVDRYLTSPFTVIPAATGHSNLRSAYDEALLVLAAIVGLVLLVGSANVVNLLLARSIERRHQMRLQLSLGASRWHLVRQLGAESLMLSAAGGLVGLALAPYLARNLIDRLSTPATVFLDVPIDGTVVSFTIGLCALTTALFATAPAVGAARLRPVGSLPSGHRTLGDRERGRLMASLLVAQVALSTVLLVGAGLFVRSFSALAAKPLGLEPNAVLAVTVDPSRLDVPRDERVAVYERLRVSVAALPDVANAAVSHLVPTGGGGFTPPLAVGGAAARGLEPTSIPTDSNVFGNVVSARWFDTLGIDLKAGREFTDADRRGAPRVAVVNETFARRFFGTESPLGRRLTVYPNTPRALDAEIVGVVVDAIYSSPRGPVPATWFMPMAQFDTHPFSSAILTVRSKMGTPDHLGRQVEAAAATIDSGISLTFRPLGALVRASLSRERMLAQLAAFLGGLAWLLAGLGLYGVTAYAVSSRRSEIAVRMALGARPGRMVAGVVGRVLGLVGVGIAAGAAIAYWAGPIVGGLVRGVSTSDPLALTGAAVMLLALGAAASWLPARRASRVDPLAVLREN